MKMLKNKNTLILLGTVVAAFVLGLFASRISVSFNGHEHENEEMHSDDHEGHGHEEEDHEELSLSLRDIQEFGIKTGYVEKGTIAQSIQLSGEISYNENRLAHIVPRIEGVIREVNFNLGDQVEEGDVLAVIDSRELADAKAAYLESLEKARLAKVRFEREKGLWEKQISSEEDYLNASQQQEEARIHYLSAQQKLLALGVSKEMLASIEKSPGGNFTNYEIRAPINGTIVEKHVVLGERALTDSNLFTIADLDHVWVNLTLYPKDITNIQKGQTALIQSNSSDLHSEGYVEYISPYLEESTRTATTRVVVENKDRTWRPGMFVTGNIVIGEFEVEKRIALSAIQMMDGQEVVFIRHDDGFEPSPIVTGRSDGQFVEVVQGLAHGLEYVQDNSFVLKAEMKKSSFGDGHGH